VFVRLLVLLPVSFFIIKDIPVFNFKIVLFLTLITFEYITERTLLTKAYQLATITSIQPLRYFNIVFSVVLSYLILGEKLSLWQGLGVAMIVGSGVLLKARK
jgi:drug/metabolite transporter (DMT)-like permease